MFMADWRAATALFACIFLPLLLCSGGVFTLSLQKPHLLYSSAKKDTASIAVRKKPSLYMYASPHTAVTGYEGRDLINNPDAEHRGTVLNVSYCVFYKVVAVGFDTLYYGEKRRGTKHSA